MKIQIMGWKVCLRCIGKTLLGGVNQSYVFHSFGVNKLLKTKSLLTLPSNVLPFYLEQTFPPIISIFTEDESDGIEARLSSYIFSTLHITKLDFLTLQDLLYYSNILYQSNFKLDVLYRQGLDPPRCLKKAIWIGD